MVQIKHTICPVKNFKTTIRPATSMEKYIIYGFLNMGMKMWKKYFKGQKAWLLRIIFAYCFKGKVFSSLFLFLHEDP